MAEPVDASWNGDWNEAPPGAVRLEALLGRVVVDTVLLMPPFPPDLATIPVEGCIVDPFWPMDDEVVVIEALKMETGVFAPFDGTVKEIRVKEGDSVEEDDVLLVVTT